MSKYYMGGICGMGMAPLAAFLQEDGSDVSGFDDTPNLEVKKYLGEFGVVVAQKTTSLEEFDKIVISTALKRQIPELKKQGAKEILLRGECWAELCAKRRLCAIMGSHGKSTVSSLVAHAINKFSLNGGWLTGAIPVGFPMHKHCVENEILVSEIDESDGTIEAFSPEVTVALNADLDHTDTYANWDELKAMYARLFERTKRKIIIPENDKILREIAKNFSEKVLLVPVAKNFNETNKNIAKSILKEVFDRDFSSEIFDDFKGIRRRQEVIKENNSSIVIADYAHHPTELKAFLEMFNSTFVNWKKIVVFQPHRYSRTKQFADIFTEILSGQAQVGKVFLAPVYAASEIFDNLGTSEAIIKKSKNSSIVLAKSEEIFKIINASILKEEKLAVAIVGAGDIYFDAKKFLG